MRWLWAALVTMAAAGPAYAETWMLPTPTIFVSANKATRLIPTRLSPIVGRKLRALIIGSVVSEGPETHDASGGELYQVNGLYQFLGPEVWSTRARYEVSTDRVCILTHPHPVCFAYFKDYRGRYVRLQLETAEKDYRLVQIQPIGKPIIRE